MCREVGYKPGMGYTKKVVHQRPKSVYCLWALPEDPAWASTSCSWFCLSLHFSPQFESFSLSGFTSCWDDLLNLCTSGLQEARGRPSYPTLAQEEFLPDPLISQGRALKVQGSGKNPMGPAEQWSGLG